jgi:anti-sigma factor RsiW
MAAKTKITCQSFLDEMSDYIDGALADDLRVSLEAHLAKCPNCWVLLDETKRTVEIFGSYDCHPLPDNVRNRLKQAIAKSWSEPDPK